MTDTGDQRVAYRTCPLCEATCGLEITLEGDTIKRIRGDRDDVFSHGFICPKGSTLKQLHEDPDWLRAPLVKDGDGWREVTWDEAFAAVEVGLSKVWDAHGRNAVALYLGNPSVHHMSGALYLRPLIQSVGTRNLCSASTVDQMPKHVSSGLLFGDPGAMPVPDLDRTDFLLMLGANPWESNGSLCTAPDFPGRVKAIQARGGRVVVVDPRRTRTAEEADEHVAIRPGADAHLLLAMIQVVLADGLADAGTAGEHSDGLDDLPEAVASFTPEAVAAITGLAADDIRRLAREFAAAPTAVALRPHRHPHRVVRDTGGLGRRRPQPGHRQPGSAGWGHVPPRRALPPPGRRRGRSGLHHRSLDQSGAGLPGGPGRDPGGVVGRRDGDPGRRPGTGPHHGGRQPCPVDPGRRPARCRHRRPRVSRRRRPLHQRDLPPRRRDPAAAVRLDPGPLRPGLLRPGRAQRGQLLPAGPPRRGRRRRARDPGPPRPDRRRSGGVGRPRHRGRPALRRAAGLPADRPRLSHRRPGPGRDPGGGGPPPAGGAPVGPHVAGRSLRRRLRHRPRRAVHGQAGGQPPRHRPRGVGAPPARPAQDHVGSGRGAERAAAGRSRPPGRQPRGARERDDGPDRAPPRAFQQLLDAQRRRPGEGQGPVHPAGASRRRRPPRPGRRRHGPGQQPGGPARRPRRGHRLGPPRRRVASPTAGATTCPVSRWPSPRSARA